MQIQSFKKMKSFWKIRFLLVFNIHLTRWELIYPFFIYLLKFVFVLNSLTLVLINFFISFRWIVWFVVFVSGSLDQSRNKLEGNFILRVSVFLVVVMVIHLTVKKMNVWSTMEMRSNVVEAVLQIIILFHKKLLVLWLAVRLPCRIPINFLCLRLFRVLVDVRRLSTVGNRDFDVLDFRFRYCFYMCNIYANVLFQYDIVNLAQTQIGKVLILYFALVRSLNQYLERH